jgi:ketosteroid isomerase-like protein
MSQADRERERVNKECVTGWLESRNGDVDVERMGQFVTEDVVRWGPRPSFLEGPPRDKTVFPPGPAHGRERQLFGWRPENSIYEPGSTQIEIERMIAEGDFVTAQYVLRARTRRGRPYENYYHFLYECEDGRIKTIWEYVDTLYSQKMLFDE